MQPYLKFEPNPIETSFFEDQTYEFADGDLICGEHNTKSSFFLITEGAARVSISSARGAERLMFYARPGNLIGEGFCFWSAGEHPDGIQAHAMGACKVKRISHSAFRQACAENPDFAMLVLSKSYAKLSTIIEQLQYATFRDTVGQIASLLLAIFQEVQESQPDKLIRMTHQSMAAATGRTRVSVTHALSKIQEAGAIRLSRASIEVLDAKILEKLSLEPGT